MDRGQRVGDSRIVDLLRTEFDESEAEAEIILLDERDARRAAKRMNLKVLGTVGVLIWARKVGKVMTLKEQLDALREYGKFRISQALYERALHEVGEL